MMVLLAFDNFFEFVLEILGFDLDKLGYVLVILDFVLTLIS
jgi:hypothetical protein